MRKLPFLFFLLLLVVWVSCGKDPENPAGDNRDNYVGSYQLQKSGYIYSGANATIVDTTITVTVGKSGDENITLLDADIRVNSEGRFGAFNTGDCVISPIPNYNVFCGYFKSDSLVFETFQGSLMNGSQFNYKGIKQ